MSHKSTFIDSWFIIANATSGKGSFSKRWQQIQQLLKTKGINYSFAFTEYAKHEIKLVQNAIKKGFSAFIVIGGDGTLHHVVNGIMQQRYINSADVTIGVIPLGTGNDWIKTYNIPEDIEKSITIISKQNTILQDIGVLKTSNSTLTYFCNVAGMGFDAYVVQKLNKLRIFGSLSYILVSVYAILAYKKNEFTISYNGKEITTKSLLTAFGICQFTGGGMQLTKDINSTDGLLDISILKDIHLFDLIFNIRKLFSGNITQHKKIHTSKTKAITIIPKDKNTLIQADGELIGTGKIEATLLEKALNFVINRY